jgi:uncharacterized membrane protein
MYRPAKSARPNVDQWSDRGLAIGPMGIVAPLAMLAAIAPVAVGVAAGEPLGAPRAAGLALALVGGVLCVGGGRRPASAGLGRAPLFGLLAAVGGAGWILAIRRAGELGDPLVAAMAYRAWSVTGAACLLAVQRPNLRPALARLPRLAAIGLLEACSTVLYTTALTIGLLTVVPILGSLFPFVTALIARRVLHERLNRREREGLLAVVAGVLVVVAAGGG